MLNSTELKLCQKLGECFNDFYELPEQHPSDRAEFVRAIHAAQNIIMSRSARASHPEVFYCTPIQEEEAG